MRKLNVTIVAGLVVALIGAALVVVYGRGVDQRIADGKELVSVFVATSDIAAGATSPTVGAAVETRQIPRAYLVEQPLLEMDPASTLVTKGFISKGSQLSTADFGPPDTAAAVKPVQGRVNLAIEVALTPGVARYVTPGSTVDMFVTYAAGAQGDGSPAVTKLFASSVKVVSVSIAQPVAVDGESSDAATPQGDQVLAVLDVDPLLAQDIVNAVELGRIYLALTAGDEHLTPAGVTPAGVLENGR